MPATDRQEFADFVDASSDELLRLGWLLTGDLDARADLAATVRTLPPRQRAVIALRFFVDLTEAETAATVGCSVGTVKSQTSSKALATLRSQPHLLNVKTPPGGAREPELARRAAA